MHLGVYGLAVGTALGGFIPAVRNKLLARSFPYAVPVVGILLADVALTSYDFSKTQTSAIVAFAVAMIVGFVAGRIRLRQYQQSLRLS